MSKSLRTLIEWAHYTLNFWWGCTKVSEACKYCYALSIARRLSGGRATWGAGGGRWNRYNSAESKLPKIVRAAKKGGERPRVFVNSMSDTFEDHPALPLPRREMLELFERTPEVDFLLLTKRPENVRRMVPDDWVNWQWPAHVWIGTTVEHQAAADARVPELLKVPAAVRFLSCEPLLGRVDLRRWLCSSHNEPPVPETPTWAPDVIHWVIAGGESGQSARPSNPDWFRKLRDDCAEFGTAFFFKQWGEWVRDADITVRFAPKKSQIVPYGDGDPTNFRRMYRVGKKNAGRKLDKVEHNAVPNRKN